MFVATSVALLSDDICASLAPHPYLMHLLRVDIPSRAGTYSLLFRVRVIGIRVGYRAVENKMGRLAAMLVRRIMRIAMRQSATGNAIDDA